MTTWEVRDAVRLLRGDVARLTESVDRLVDAADRTARATEALLALEVGRRLLRADLEAVGDAGDDADATGVRLLQRATTAALELLPDAEATS